jgi:hypothetical protein
MRGFTLFTRISSSPFVSRRRLLSPYIFTAIFAGNSGARLGDEIRGEFIQHL